MANQNDRKPTCRTVLGTAIRPALNDVFDDMRSADRILGAACRVTQGIDSAHVICTQRLIRLSYDGGVLYG